MLQEFSGSARRLVIVSNRLPVAVPLEGEKPSFHESAYTMKSGVARSRARYTLRNHREVVELLQEPAAPPLPLPIQPPTPSSMCTLQPQKLEL